LENIENKKNIKNRINIDINVPISKLFPNKDRYVDLENIEDIRKTRGIRAPKMISLSFGNTTLPSPSLAINQKNRDIVTPTERRKPLLSSRVIET